MPVTVVFVNDSGPALAVRPKPKAIPATGEGQVAVEGTGVPVEPALPSPEASEPPMGMEPESNAVTPAPTKKRRARHSPGRATARPPRKRPARTPAKARRARARPKRRPAPRPRRSS